MARTARSSGVGGLASSAGSGRLEFGDGGVEGPVEPGAQSLDVRGLDRRAAPDAQARRGVAVAADVEGHALLLEQRSELLGEVGLGRFRRAGDALVDDL